MHQPSIIGKQTVDIVYDGEVDPFAFRDDVSWFCTSKLIPAIEKICEKYSPENKVICFDSLTIDAGEIPADNWQDVLVERVVGELLDYIGSTAMPQQIRWTKEGTVLHPEEIVKRELSMETSRRETLVHFLKFGTLSWSSAVKNKASLNALFLELTNNRGEIRRVIQLVHEDQRYLKRLIHQFANDILEKFILVCSGINDDTLVALKELMIRIAQAHEGKVSSREEMYSILISSLKEVASNSKAYTSETLIHVLESDHFKLLVRDVSGANPTVVNETVRDILKIDELNVLGDLSPQITAQIDKILLTKHDSKEETGSLKKEDKREKRAQDFILDKDVSFISNAGLVILHPFLSMLFENVGYTENKKWISIDLQQRAMMLMQFMVRPDTEAGEFDLLLNKIFVGYPLEETLPFDIVLSEFEKQEATDVLTSVLKHWAALKNTSVPGLQSEFLQRDAKLFLESGLWNLKVEQKTSDILMNRLPWGISMVKTPWMKNMMQVEWT